MYLLYPEDCVSGAQKYIKDNSIDLIITDPPYGIEGDQLHKHYHRDEKYVIGGYVEIPRAEYQDFSLSWIHEAERVLRPGGSIYIISGYSNLYDILSAIKESSLEEINHIIWKYNFGVYTNKKYVTSHYHILYLVKPGGKVTFNTYSRFGFHERDINRSSLNYQDREDVWLINRKYKPGQIKNKNALPHELLIKLMQYSSNEGDLIADFFLGGFSTASVAIGLNRNITGFEINTQSYDYHIAEIEHLSPGYLLDSLKTGKDEQPKNQRKRWTEEELSRLLKRYLELKSKQKSKRKVIATLQDEFQRGYFAIFNKISEITND